MVPIPRIKHGLLHHLGYTAGLMVGRLCVARLSDCVSIEGLEVHNSSWFSVSLPYDHHAVAPCVRRAYGDLLKDPETDVAI